MFLTAAPVHVPAGLLPPDGPGDRPGPGGGVRAVDPGDLRGRVAGRAACRPTPTSTSTRSSTRRRGGRAGESVVRAPGAGDGTVDARGRRCLAGDPAAPPAGGPTPRSGPSTRRAAVPRRGSPPSGRPSPAVITIDLAVVDARPADAALDRRAAGARRPRRAGALDGGGPRTHPGLFAHRPTLSAGRACRREVRRVMRSAQ